MLVCSTAPAMSDYWQRSLALPRPPDLGVAVAVESVSLAVCLACLVHVLVGWRVHKLEWTVMRRVGCAVAAALSLDYTLTLSCNAIGDACSHPTQVVVYNIFNNGLLLPLVFCGDMYLLYERYRALSEAEANLGGAVYTVPRILQLASLLLTIVTCFGVWPWWIVLPWFTDVNTDAYRTAFSFLTRTFMVRYWKK